MWGAFPLTYVHCVLKRTVLLNTKTLVKDYLLMPSGWVVHNAEGDKAKIGTYNPIEKTMTSPTGVVEDWSTSRLVGNRLDEVKEVKKKKKKKGRALAASKQNNDVMITVEATLDEKDGRFFYDDEDDDDPERTLFVASWYGWLICCFLCTNSENSNNGDGVDMVDNTQHDVKPFKIQVTDSHVIWTTRNKLLWWLPVWAHCFGGCPQVNKKSSRIDGLNAVIVREDGGCATAGCMGMFLMYLVWFLFGPFGGHYWYKSKRFAHTRKHKWFLFFYLFTFGGFGFLWLLDGFRIGNWVGGYTIIFHGEAEEDTWSMHLKSGKIAHAIRDSLYVYIVVVVVVVFENYLIIFFRLPLLLSVLSFNLLLI